MAAEILGIDYVETKPKYSKPTQLKNNFNKKYVCIGSLSTAQAKFWNNVDGWNKVVTYLQSIGYDVVSIDKISNIGNSGYHNEIPIESINKTGDFPLSERINDLYFCDFFIGLGSGLSWLAWMVEKPVVLISGFSDPKSEFFTPYRVHNKSVCNSCWNDTNFVFDAKKWDWCPRNKEFECSSMITFEMVKEKIDKCISDLKK
jgi:autotransporter strand-loop-strand O-heptosyltransferase